MTGQIDVSTLNSYYTKTEIDTTIYNNIQIGTSIYTTRQSGNLLNAQNICIVGGVFNNSNN